MRSLIITLLFIAIPAICWSDETSADDKAWFEEHGCKPIAKRPDPLPPKLMWAKGYLCHESNFRDVPPTELLKRFSRGGGAAPPPADTEKVEKPPKKTDDTPTSGDGIPTLEEWARGHGCKQEDRPYRLRDDQIWHKGYLCSEAQAIGWQDLNDQRLIKEAPAVAYISLLRGLFAIEEWRDKVKTKIGKPEKGFRYLAVAVGTIRAGISEEGDSFAGGSPQSELSTNPLHVQLKCRSEVYKPSLFEPKKLGARYPSMELEPGEQISGWVVVELPNDLKPGDCKARFKDFSGKSRWVKLSDSFHLTRKKK